MELVCLLPRATTGTNAPLLERTVTGSGTGLVTLAKDNEVSGLKYQRTSGNGSFIYATGNVGNFNINHNTTVVGKAGQAGVSLVNVTGTGVISENNFANHTLNAIGIAQLNSSMTLAVQKNAFNGGLTGIAYTQTGGDNRLTVDGNTFSSGTNGIVFTNVSGNSRMLVQKNAFSTTNGIIYTQIAGTTFNAIRDNTFKSTAAVLDTSSIAGTQTLQLRNNGGTGTYTLIRIPAATFNLETFLGTNPAPTKVGTIGNAAPGAAGFP